MREGERDRNINVWLPLAHPPGIYPDWELNQRPFSSQAGVQSTEPYQPWLVLIFRSEPTYTYSYACVLFTKYIAGIFQNQTYTQKGLGLLSGLGKTTCRRPGPERQQLRWLEVDKFEKYFGDLLWIGSRGRGKKQVSGITPGNPSRACGIWCLLQWRTRGKTSLG